MTQQTQTRERSIRTSIYGSGREHYHCILSKSRGLDRVVAVSTFETWPEAAGRAHKVKAAYASMGFATRTYGAGAILALEKDGETSSYLMSRRCYLKHNIDG